MSQHPNHGHGERHSQQVVLELGDGIGALIVYTDPELLGTEEISPSADDSRRSHREVLRRAAGNGESHALVFDNLPQGAYTLWLGAVARSRNVLVESGTITELDWRRPSKSERPAAEERAADYFTGG